MTKYTNVPSDLYILKSDLPKLDNGGEVEGHITVSNPDNYELVEKYFFQPSIQIDNNTYLVTLIFK
jgi:hypothetical protein